MNGGILLSGAEDIWMAERVMVNCEFCVLVERTLVRRCVVTALLVSMDAPNCRNTQPIFPLSTSN